jgi:hypothetical protein
MSDINAKNNSFIVILPFECVHLYIRLVFFVNFANAPRSEGDRLAAARYSHTTPSWRAHALVRLLGGATRLG